MSKLDTLKIELRQLQTKETQIKTNLDIKQKRLDTIVNMITAIANASNNNVEAFNTRMNSSATSLTNVVKYGKIKSQSDDIQTSQSERSYWSDTQLYSAHQQLEQEIRTLQNEITKLNGSLRILRIDINNKKTEIDTEKKRELQEVLDTITSRFQ